MSIIELSKNGRKHKGRFSVVVDDSDEILNTDSWNVIVGKYSFHAYRNLNGEVQLMHRVIVERFLNRKLNSDEFVIHLDNNYSNNKRDNLVIANRSEAKAHANRHGKFLAHYRGVYRAENGRYKANISVNGKTIHLGAYDSDEEAYQAYCSAAIKYWGKIANLG